MRTASCSKGKTVTEVGLELTVRASCSESGTVADELMFVTIEIN